MSLLSNQIIILSAGSAALFFLPLWGLKLKSGTSEIFFIGTGALVGLCGFDLIPELFEMGGHKSLITVGSIWLVYCLLHVFHVGHHRHAHGEDCPNHHAHLPKKLSALFVFSVVSHSFADGMLLTLSGQMSALLSQTIFIALLIHKAFEAVTVASLAVGQSHSKKVLGFFSVIYLLAFPAGALLTAAAEKSAAPFLTPHFLNNATIVVLSISLGSLLSCLVFDFLLPSLALFKARRRSAAWFALGLVATVVMIHVTHG